MVRKILEKIVLLAVIIGLSLSGWPFGVTNVKAATGKIRQEINILNTYAGSSAGQWATSSEVVRLNPNNYSNATYYFEVVASTSAATNATISLRNASSSAVVASITVNGTSYTRYRSSSFTPSQPFADYVVVYGNEAARKGTNAARIVILHDGEISKTETQIEIGSKEDYTSISTTTFSAPKYWHYDSSVWDSNLTYYAGVTYAKTGNPLGTAATTTDTFATAGVTSWTAPSDTTLAQVACWGGGGSGWLGDANGGGAGGGGGAFASSTLSVVGNTSYSITVGAGGTSGFNGGNGGTSTFNNASVVAPPGGGGKSVTTLVGAGGLLSLAVGTVKFAGGNGGQGANGSGNNDQGGGGGGAGGPRGTGSTGSNASGTLGGAGGAGSGGFGGTAGTAGNGGGGGTGGTSVIGGGGGGGGDNGFAGGDGGTYGGGGGGGESAPGSGASGACTVTYRTQAALSTVPTTTIALQEDNGSFGGWTDKVNIVSASTTATAQHIRSVPFTPVSGRNYRIAFRSGYNGATFTIYNAKIIVSHERLQNVGTNMSIPATVNTPAAVALSASRIALIDAGRKALEAYDFDGSVWTQVGNSFALTDASSYALAKMTSSRVAVSDAITDTLRTYDFDGTNWSQVGNALTITGLTSVDLTGLTDTSVACSGLTPGSFMRTYSFDGTDWSQVGNTLATNFSKLATLSSTKIISIGNTRLETVEFDGTDWTRTSSLPHGYDDFTTTGTRGIASLSSTRIAMRYGNKLHILEYDGQYWKTSGPVHTFNSSTEKSTLAALSSTRFAVVMAGTDYLLAYDLLPQTPELIEPQYLIANKTLTAGTSPNQLFRSYWDPAEWTATAISYIHEATSVSGGASGVKLYSVSDITGSDITSITERKRSSAMTMPGSAGTLSIQATTNNNDIYSSRILAQVSLAEGATVPNAPTNVSATLGAGYVNLSWVGSSDGGSAITSYEIYRGTSASPTTLYATVASSTSYHDTGVTNNTTYYYRLKAVNAIGSSSYSSDASTAPTGGTSLIRTLLKFGGARLKIDGGRIQFR